MPAPAGLLYAQRQAFAPPASPTPAVQLGPVQAYMNQQAQQFQQAQQYQAAQYQDAARQANPYIGALEQRSQMFAPAQPQQEDQGWFGDIASAVMKPLQYLAYPGKAVVSGIEEVGEALGGDDWSVKDWWKNVEDPTYGFGTLLERAGVDAGKWGNRFLGFAGDVALDPLSYVTLGSTKFAGAGGRLALAERAAGLGDEVVEKVARLGESALTAAQRESIGLGKAGLRIGLPSSNVRLPFSGPAATYGGRVLAGTRGMFTGTKMGAAARRMGASRAPELRPFVERLMTRKGEMTPTRAIAGYAAQNSADAVQGEFLGKWVRPVVDAGKKLRGRSDVYHAVEAGVDNAETRAFKEVTEGLFGSSTSEYGVTALKERQNFAPHYNQPEFNEFLGNATGDTDTLIDGRMDLLGGGSGRLQQRRWEPGKTYKINGKEITFEPGRPVTAADIEQKFHDAFPEELGGKKLIEDDPEEVLNRLLQDHARDAGEAAREFRLEAGGAVQAKSAVTSDKRIAWDDATRAERKWARKEAKKRNAQYKDMASRAREHRGVLGEHGARRIKKVVTAEEVLLERANRLQRLAEGRLTETEVAQAEAAARRATIPGEVADIAGGRTPDVRQVEVLAAHINQLDDAIDNLRVRIRESEDPAYQMALRMAEDRRKSLMDAVASGKQAGHKIESLKRTQQTLRDRRLAQEPLGAMPPMPGQGPGIELATPETAAYGAQGQAIRDLDVARRAQGMAELRPAMSPAPADMEAALARLAEAGTDVELARAGAQPAVQNREALLALGAPKLNRKMALQAKEAAEVPIQRARAVEAEAKQAVEVLGHEREDFLAQLAEVATGTPTRPTREIEADIKFLGKDPGRQKRILGALENIAGPNQRIGADNARAVRRELNLDELRGGQALDAEVMSLLPQRAQDAIREESLTLDELVRPWTEREDLARLRPEQDYDWMQGDPSRTPAATKKHADRLNTAQTRLNALEAEEDALSRGVAETVEGPVRGGGYEKAPWSREVEDPHAEVRAQRQTELADAEQRWNDHIYARAERERVRSTRATVQAELDKTRAQRGRVVNMKQSRKVSGDIAELEQRVAELSRREAELPEMLTRAEQRDARHDIFIAEQRLDELPLVPAAREGTVPRRVPERQGRVTQQRRQPRHVAADPNAAKRAELQSKIEQARRRLGARPLTKREQQLVAQGRPIPRAAEGRAASHAQRERAMMSVRSLERELEALGPPPLSARQEAIQDLRDEIKELQSTAPGERYESIAESRRAAAGERRKTWEGLGSPMDKAEVRDQSDRVARLYDLAVRYKRAIDTGAEPGEATFALAARSVMEDEQGRLASKASKENLALRLGADEGEFVPKYTDDEIEGIVERQWQREQEGGTQRRQEYDRAKVRADQQKAEAKAAHEQALAKGGLVGKDGKPISKTEATRLYRQRIRDIDAQLPAKPPWESSSAALRERMFKDQQRTALKVARKPLTTTQSKEAREALGEFFAQFLEPAARNVMDARQERAYIQKMLKLMTEGKLVDVPPEQLARLGSFQELGGINEATGEIMTKELQQLQADEAAQQLGIGGRRRTTEGLEDTDIQEFVDEAMAEEGGGGADVEAFLRGGEVEDIGLGGKFDTMAIVSDLDAYARNKVIEETRGFGELLQRFTGSRWKELSGEPKRLFAGGKGLEPLGAEVTQAEAKRLGLGAAQGPIHPRAIGGRGKGATLSPGRLVTMIAGRGQKQRAKFLADLFERIPPEARARVLEVIRDESLRTTRALREMDQRVARLGGAGGTEGMVAGDWFDLLTRRGALEEAPTPQDLTSYFQPGKYKELTGERARYRGAQETVDQRLAELRQPLTPEAQAELDQLARTQSANRQPAVTRREMVARQRAGEYERELAVPGEIGALEPTVRGGREAETKLAKPIETMAKEIADNELLGADRQTLQNMIGNRDYAQQVSDRIQTRINARTQALGKEWFALGDTDKILAGQADERLNDAVAIERGVRTAQQRVKRVQGVSVPAKVNTTAAYEQLVKDMTDAASSGADQTTLDLLRSTADIVPKMQDLDARAQHLDQMSKMLASGKGVPIMRTVFKDNFAAFTSQVTGRDLAIDRTVQRAFNEINEKIIKAKPGPVGKLFDTYTQFFKTYATMTPGFHVRNALGAMFMNTSDGASLINQGAGVKLWTAYRQNPRGEWWKTLPKAYQDKAKDVVRAVYGSGAGGGFSAAEVGAAASGQMAKGAKRAVMQNRAVRFTRRVGEAIEGGVRAGLALDTLMNGGTVSEATQRINRIHFNYSHVSEFDAKMRKLVPFWTYMSRNVPLQMQQMMLRPKTYLTYEKFRKNFDEDSGQGFPLMPKYLKELGAFRLTPGVALAPEFGPSQMQESLREFGSMKMLSNLNPLLKNPAQALTGQNFFYGAPYGKSYQQLGGTELSWLEPVLGMLGQTEQIPGGGTAVPQQSADIVRDLIPPLAQINRLVGTTPEREGRTTQALWNFLGFPGKQMTPEVMAAERRRQQGSAYYGQLDEMDRLEALAALRG